MFTNAYLIDDDKNTLFLHKYFLKSYDFYDNLLEYSDATKAMESLISDTSGNENIVLLDLNMPIMSGWEFVDQITDALSLKQLETTTIIIVSSSCNPRDISRADAHTNIYSFIEKPFMPKDVESLLASLKTTLTLKRVA